jgi:RNase P/RNase MRP subunit p29
MTVNCENLLWHGIIGHRAKILESSDSTLQGIVGTIVFETKNTIFIRKDSLVKQVAKRAAKKAPTSNILLRLLYKWFRIDR